MENINDRQKQVLKIVVEEYVKTSQPIGSTHVVEMMAMPVSSATVRNDMADLTLAGLLEQPHTSAGRIPTEAGYRLYIDQTMREQKEISTRQQEVLLNHFKKLKNLQERLKEATRMLSELSGSVGLLIDEKDQVYMSGLSQLARLPEFRDESFSEEFMNLLEDPVSEIKRLAPQGDESKVIMGSDNPITGKSSIVITRVGPDGNKIISVIGPVRMSYGRTFPAMEFIKKLLEE